MLLKWQFNLLLALGIVALLLVFANATLFVVNRESQAVLAQRQLYVQQSVPLEGLYRDIVKALAELGTKTNDRQVLDILTAQGLSVTTAGVAAPTLDAADKNAKSK